MEAVSPRGRRQIPAASFFRGFWTTDLDADELLVGVRLPVWTGRCGFAVREFARRHGDFAVAGAVVGVQVDADDRIERCLLGLGPTPLRATDAEQQVVGQKPDLDADEVGRLAVAGLTDVPSDVHGSDRYRTRVGAAMVTRAWHEAIGEAIRG
jgi:carbon-monoxide dehydrogenase medium subunit